MSEGPACIAFVADSAPWSSEDCTTNDIPPESDCRLCGTYRIGTGTRTYQPTYSGYVVFIVVVRRSNTTSCSSSSSSSSLLLWWMKIIGVVVDGGVDGRRRRRRLLLLLRLLVVFFSWCWATQRSTSLIVFKCAWGVEKIETDNFSTCEREREPS